VVVTALPARRPTSPGGRVEAKSAPRRVLPFGRYCELPPWVGSSLRVLEALARVRTLVVVFVVIFVVATIAAAIDPNRPTGSSPHGVYIDLALLAFLLSPLAWVVLWIAYKVGWYRRVESFECRDASPSPVAPMAHFYAQGVTLLRLGFQPVGQLEYRWPWQKWKRAWIFTNPAYRIDAALGIRPQPAFSSHWPDGSSVITRSASRNQALDLPGTRIVGAAGPTEVVYGRHLQQAAEFDHGRGQRLPTQSMVDVLAHESSEVRLLRAAIRASWVRLAPQVAVGVVAGVVVVILLQLSLG
jgi:hypothetical protein